MREAMKSVVIRTSDGLEIVGRIDPDKETRSPFMGSASNFLTVYDPLEIKYRSSELGYSTALFMKYDYYNESDYVRINVGSIVSLYDLSSTYQKTYEESVKSISEEMSKRNEDKKSSKESGIKSFEDAVAALTKALSNTSYH